MIRALRWGLFAVALGLWGCGDEAAVATAPTVFVAMQDDFRGYATWPSRELGTTTLAGHPSGPRRVYIRGAIRPGDTAWPVGTMLVKEIRVMESPQSWELFAMVKRGGGYNPDGAAGWEFFLLRLNSAGVPVLVSRGYAPSNGQFDPYTGLGMGCNGCHGHPDARAFDSILTPSLRPGGTTAP